MVAVKPLTPTLWPGTAHMFLGPSGVGKTTILLRLEARRRAPDVPVTVVNADSGRGKGRLMLRHYAELSGLTYAEADGPEDFARLLRAARGEAVFVDTPSLSRQAGLGAWHEANGLAGATGRPPGPFAHLLQRPGRTLSAPFGLRTSGQHHLDEARRSL